MSCGIDGFFHSAQLSKRTTRTPKSVIVVHSSWGIGFKNIPLNESLSNIFADSPIPSHQGLRPRSPSPIASAFGRYPVDAARNPPSFRQCHQRSAPWEGGVMACLGKVGRGSQQNALGGIDRVNDGQLLILIMDLVF